MKATYCEVWSDELRSPTDVMTEGEARTRYARGESFCVVLGDTASPQAVLEVVPENKFIGVNFVDEEGRTHTALSFTNMGNGKFFMNELVMWSYEPGAENMSGAHRIENLEYRPDGYLKRTIEDDSVDHVEEIEYKDVPVDVNWEPEPEFGHWESIARFDRDAPAGQ